MQARTPSCLLQQEGQVTAFAGPSGDSKMPDGLNSSESKEGLGEPWGQHRGPVPSCVHIHGVPALRAPSINQSPRPGRASHPQKSPRPPLEKRNWTTVVAVPGGRDTQAM